MQNLDTLYNKFLMNKSAIENTKTTIRKGEDLRKALGAFLSDGHATSIISDSSPNAGSRYTLNQLVRDPTTFRDMVASSRPLNGWEEELVDPLLKYVHKQVFSLPDLKKIRKGIVLSFADAYAATYIALSKADRVKATDMFREVLHQWN